MALTRNVGGADKAVRLAVGSVLTALALLTDIDDGWKVAAGVVAAIALATALVGFCPLNRALGINTCRHRL